MAVSGFGKGCDAEQVRVGRIRTSRRGDTCTDWVQAPATVGVPLSAQGKLILGGWMRARVALLQSRPLRCYRCLAPGHVQERCPCPTDRTRGCFNCGELGHFAENCRNRPHCPPCAERSKRADHRPGGAGCTPVNPRSRPLSSPPPRTRTGGRTKGDAETGAASVPGRAEDGASQGSSLHSPPGKKVRVERPSSPVGEEPLPQRKPRTRSAVSSGASPAPEIVEEAEMDDKTEETVEGQA